MQPTFTHYLNRRTAVYSMAADSEKTIVLIHGNSVHAGFFEPLMELLVQNGFNAVAFDLPGHGNSDKWNPEEYNTPNLLNLFLHVIENYGRGETGIFGFSLGGVFLIELLPLLKEKHKIAIAGSPPLNSSNDVSHAYILNEKVLKVFQGEFTRADALDYYHGILTYGDQNRKEEILQSVLATDPNLRLALAVMVGEIKGQVETINRYPGEFCMLHAEREAVVSLPYLQQLKLKNLWKNQIHIIPNCGHGFFIDNPKDTALVLAEFFNS